MSEFALTDQVPLIGAKFVPENSSICNLFFFFLLKAAPWCLYLLGAAQHWLSLAVFSMPAVADVYLSARTFGSVILGVSWGLSLSRGVVFTFEENVKRCWAVRAIFWAALAANSIASAWLAVGNLNDANFLAFSVLVVLAFLNGMNIVCLLTGVARAQARAVELGFS
jgi:hypothetical protein